MTSVDEESAPPFPVERPAGRPWREGAVTRANELETLRRWRDSPHSGVAGPLTTAEHRELSSAIRRHLDTARGTAARDRSLWRAMTGASLQRTASNLDAAEATLLRLAPPEYLEGQLPGLLNHVHRYLPPQDARRLQLEALISERQAAKRRLNGSRQRPSPVDPIPGEERGIIVAAVRAASSEEIRALMRAQSFRNTLVVTSAILIFLAGMAAILSMISPSTVPLCFAPQSDDRVTVVCPTSQRAVPEDGPVTSGTTPSEAVDRTLRAAAGPWDMLTVEALGLAAAAVSATVALRKVRGTNGPLAVPIALAVLKLPLGSLTAVLGILLMRGGFVPGLSALDSSSQILAWAVVFGYAQQTFTRFVDQQATTVMNKVKSEPSAEMPPAAEVTARPWMPYGGGTSGGAAVPSPRKDGETPDGQPRGDQASGEAAAGADRPST